MKSFVPHHAHFFFFFTRPPAATVVSSLYTIKMVNYIASESKVGNT